MKDEIESLMKQAASLGSLGAEARQLGEDSVTEARCADCPALDPAVNVVRLAALAKSGDLANP